ncbi:FHA domain-containing protein [Crocinitomicaceae bacterium]|nr:FHA domain-containing protein [Crocinitomicaceae bacterium]
MRRLLGVLLFVLIEQTTLYSQSNELNVRNVNVDDFPSYSGELHVRNPEGVEKSRVKFITGDSLFTVDLQDGKKATEIAKNKVVLFVVLNNPAHKDRTKWYKSVVENAMNNGMMKDGDQFAVVSFDCPRPEYDQARHLLFPETPVFTDNSSDIVSQINNISVNQKRHSICGSRGDIYGAIYKSIDVLNKFDSDLPKSIVILADDWSLTKQIKETQIQKKSKDYNIPIYGITYYQRLSTRNWGVEGICNETYGRYFIDKKNNLENTVQALLDFGDDMIPRASGMVYKFTFDANVPKSSEIQTIKVQYEGHTTAFQYSVPEMTTMEWISDNPITTGGLALGFILLIVIVVVLVKKQKRKAAEEKTKHDEELRKVEEQQRQSDSVVSEQAKAIAGMKEAERRKEAEKIAEVARKKAEEENTLKLQQMSARGNLPWFTYELEGNKGSFEVNHSRFVVGRDEDVIYRINHQLVSRKHFELVFDNGIYTLTDLGSSNGTSVNGHAITSSVLKHGDIVSIGDIHLTFHI